MGHLQNNIQSNVRKLVNLWESLNPENRKSQNLANQNPEQEQKNSTPPQEAETKLVEEERTAYTPHPKSREQYTNPTSKRNPRKSMHTNESMHTNDNSENDGLPDFEMRANENGIMSYNLLLKNDLPKQPSKQQPIIDTESSPDFPIFHEKRAANEAKLSDTTTPPITPANNSNMQNEQKTI